MSRLLDGGVRRGGAPTPDVRTRTAPSVDKGLRTRAGFVAITEINRYDFVTTWSARIKSFGLVVGNTVTITIDVESVSDGD